MNILDKSVKGDGQDKKNPSGSNLGSKDPSQKGYSSDAMKNLIDKDQARMSSISQKNNLLAGSIMKMENHYKKNLF
jgi:hypothetical protein